MNIEQAVIENLRKLPVEKQRKVLEFTRSLTRRTQPEIMTPREKAEDWWNFLESQPKDTPGLPDEAVTRTAIYDG